MEPIIKVENVSKRYLINHQTREKYTALRDVIANKLRTTGKKHTSPTVEEFWALKDINFEIQQGDRVGIIGRNGAGKSTLLKILSRITEPTTGNIFLKGRVASLLEVGTGFHPELTGRENIYLNGAILGMSKVEIKRKFDEIVEFAEVEKFLDTPVKRYSSGMYVRLAFAVASHLESEVLIVDEVLAVGDVQFQKKCLDKMGDISTGGRTVILISHNMSSILALSSKCILLSSGCIVDQGSTYDIVSKYQNNYVENTLNNTNLESLEHCGNGKAIFSGISIRPMYKNEKISVPASGCDLEFELEVHAYERIRNSTVAIVIYDEFNNRIIDVNTLIKGASLDMEPTQNSLIRFMLKNVRLKQGIYSISLWLGIIDVEDIDIVHNATSFRMDARREDILYTTPFPGVYTCEFEHQISIN